MRELLYISLALLAGIGLATAQSRPYYPGDLYRYRRPAVVVIVPVTTRLSPIYSNLSMPTMTDKTGMWVSSMAKRDSLTRIAVDFAKEEAARIDRENAKRKGQN